MALDGFPPVEQPLASVAREPARKVGCLLAYRLRCRERLSLAMRGRLVQMQSDHFSWPQSAVATFAAALIVLAYWNLADQAILGAWAVAVFAVSLMATALTMAYQSSSCREQEPDRWALGMTMMSLLSGAVWGAGCWLVLDFAQGEATLLYLLALSGLSAVVASGQVALLACPVSFVVLAWAPLAVRLWQSAELQGGALAAVIAVFAALLMVLARRSQAQLVSVLTQTEQNTDLLARLSRREEHFRTLIDNLSDLIAVIDRSGRITFHSPSAERLLGVGRGGLIGLALSDLAHPDDVGVLMADIGSLLQDPQRVTSRDVRMRHVGGDWRALHVHGRAFSLASGEQAVILSAQDATEQLKVRETLRLAKEHAEAMGRAKTDFLAVMSHEIRTPMSGIIGLIDLLKTTGLTDKQREYVGALDRAGEHLSDLLNDILDFSKIEANKIDSEKVVFDLRKVVGGIMDIFRARAEAKGVRLRARISDGLPRLWTGDVRHTRQVLANLLGNAVKFTESGFVEVRIEADGQSSDGRSLLKIAVEDTGIGIAADKLGHVFEPFAQADASPSRRHGGTGLGLAISRRLVELMEGRIWAISRLGRGSTFFVLLPMEEGATLSLSDGLFSDGRRQSDSAYFAASRVLVVDDSDLNRLVIGDMLQGLGLTVETAANGAEAVEKFDGGAYALVFLDIQMPVMDGFDAAEAMRECEEFSDRERCPIIALSATALKDDRDRALEAGCDRYLVKPMRKEALIALLKTYLPEAESIPQAIRKGTFFGAGAPMLEPELLPLLPSFFSHLEEELAQLTRAVADQEIALVQRLAHQAKGNAMLFGFSDLVEVLRGLELVARAEKEGAALRDESTMEDWLEDVQQQASVVRAAFDGMNV